MTILKVLGSAALAATLTIPAVAATPTAKEFVAKAGASDLFERREAIIMSASGNPAIAKFAGQMKVDHTKSTEMVKSAAKSDGLTPAAPMLTPKQTHDIATLQAASGKARDTLYVTQQKAAHAEALTLMQGYAANGSATHLKDTAGKIAPVVQSHIDMLDKM
jgi:putative membrane protein